MTSRRMNANGDGVYTYKSGRLRWKTRRKIEHTKLGLDGMPCRSTSYEFSWEQPSRATLRTFAHAGILDDLRTGLVRVAAIWPVAWGFKAQYKYGERNWAFVEYRYDKVLDRWERSARTQTNWIKFEYDSSVEEMEARDYPKHAGRRFRVRSEQEQADFVEAKAAYQLGSRLRRV